VNGHLMRSSGRRRDGPAEGHRSGDRAEDSGPRPAPDDRHRPESHRHPIHEEFERKWRGQGCLLMSGRPSGRLAGFDPARLASAAARAPRSPRPTGRPTLAGRQESAPAGRRPRIRAPKDSRRPRRPIAQRQSPRWVVFMLLGVLSHPVPGEFVAGGFRLFACRLAYSIPKSPCFLRCPSIHRITSLCNFFDAPALESPRFIAIK
jgi:hypothetical protein